jgi:hypothetical protein
MLEILAGANLVHQLVLVSVHAGQLANMVESVQDTVGQLEGVNIAETVLHLSIDNQLREAENFSHKVESISETRLLSLFGG